MDDTPGPWRSRVTERNIEYLKAVYRLGGRPGACAVRVTDLARYLGVSASTVSIMIRRLAFKGLLHVVEGRGACLTEQGLELLKRYLWKHAILELVFVRAGVDPETARKLASRLSNMISDEDARVLTEALERPRACPHGKKIPYPEDELVGYEDYCGF